MKIIRASQDELDDMLGEIERDRLVVDLEAYRHFFDLFIREFRTFAYSGPCRAIVPRQAGPRFRSMPGHRSGGCRAEVCAAG
jgi:hypothetical protein